MPPSSINPGADIKAAAIQVLYVPLYKGLTIETILEQGRKNEQTMHYLPDERDIHRLPRQFIAAIVFSIVGEPFKAFVSQGIKERNDAVAENRNLMIELDPAIAEAFRSSVNISSKCSQLLLLLTFPASNASLMCSN